jgi:F-type H+-transporting ATPase subunit b
MLPIRYSFGLNTNLFETNVLNLAVVVGIVVTVVGDALRTLLDQRRQVILSMLQEADKKARDSQKRLEDARRAVEMARLLAQEIRTQATQVIEQESLIRQKQLEEDFQRLQERRSQSIVLARQQAIQSIVNEVSQLAVASAENILLDALGPNGKIYLKQKDLNEIHVRESFYKLKVEV